MLKPQTAPTSAPATPDVHGELPRAHHLPISAFIIARDEADRIARAIRSVTGWVDEVIVVDSGSRDDTREIARRLGATVVENAWPGYGPQKRFAEDLCRNDWLFNLDADEAASPALAKEIASLFATRRIAQADAWRVRIVEIYPHLGAAHQGAHAVRQLRLYDRRRGRFSTSSVHDTVRLKPGARTGELTAAMEHRSFRNLAAQVDKLNRYTSAQADDLAATGRRVSTLRLIIEFPLSFLKAYVVRRYFLYGAWGFILAMTHAQMRFLRLAKLREKKLLETMRAKVDDVVSPPRGT